MGQFKNASGRPARRGLFTIALCASSALVTAMMPGTTAVAQTAPGATTSTDNDVIITAQRREQRTLDVGQSISALSAQTLTDNHVAQVNDLVGLVGNVDIKEQVPGAIPVVTIRGVGLDDFSATNSASAGIYVDEVYLASTAMMSSELYDLARVEVLKGPQGTLYGRNSTAGAINIISQAPKNYFEASATAGYGNYDTTTAEGMLNVPVSNALALRFAARAVQQGEGYWRSRLMPGTIGERDVLAARVEALLHASNSVDVLFKLEGERSRSEMGQPEFFGTIDRNHNLIVGGPPQPCAPVLAGHIDNTQCGDLFGYTDTDGNPFLGDWTQNPFYHIDSWDATARVTANLGFAKLTSVTGYRHHKRGFFIDTDATPLAQTDFIQNDTIGEYSQELRLTGRSDRLDWVAGVFGSHDEVDVYTPGFHDALFATRTLTQAHQETNSAAGFANANWHLTTRLDLVTGLRYTWEHRSFVGGTLDQNPFGTSLLCLCGTPTQLTFLDDKVSDQNWSWRAGLEFKRDKNSMLYANVARGAKSGGFFSGITTNNDQLRPYAPEQLTAYEIGYKARIPDAHLRVDTSIFYYDYRDFQTFVRFDSVPLPIQKLDNVPEAHISGLDLDVTWSPVEDLDLIARLGLLDTELGAFSTTSGPVTAGNKLPNAPDATFSGAIRYAMPLGGTGWRLTSQVDFNYAGAEFKDALNDPLIESNAHTIWNGRVALTPRSDAWEAALWVRNIGDARYVVQGLDVAQLGYGNRNYNAPRTYGLDLTYHWN